MSFFDVISFRKMIVKDNLDSEAFREEFHKTILLLSKSVIQSNAKDILKYLADLILFETDDEDLQYEFSEYYENCFDILIKRPYVNADFTQALRLIAIYKSKSKYSEKEIKSIIYAIVQTLVDLNETKESMERAFERETIIW